MKCLINAPGPARSLLLQAQRASARKLCPKLWDVCPSLTTSPRLSPGPLDFAADPEKTSAADYGEEKSDHSR